MKKISLLSIVFLLLFSCDGFNDCKDCQAAIDHMAGKLSNYACNPNVMDDAWKRIQNDCGAMGDTYVGYMAEKCNNGEGFDVYCSGASLSEANPRLGVETKGVPDSLVIIISVEKTFGISVNFGIKRTDYIEQTLTESLSEGDEVEILVQNALNDETVAQESNTFTFERNNSWSHVRNAVIKYDATSGYSVSFEDW